MATHAQIAAAARKPYADRLKQVSNALERATLHQAADASYREGWHAALSIIRQALHDRGPA